MSFEITEVQPVFYVIQFDIDIAGILFRWMHILAAIAAVGGMIFQRLALMPSLGVLPDESRRALHEAIRSRWSKMVMAGIAFLLASGLYNFVMTWRTYDLPGYYLPLFGVKVVLALAIFFLASALVGRSAALEGIRRNARFWLTLNMTLAIVLVCISGVLRMAKKVEKSPRSTTAAESASRELCVSADRRQELFEARSSDFECSMSRRHAAVRISRVGAQPANCGSWLSRMS